ncbi:MAG: sugar ABC transporter permease [Clostridia bacterium]|nr:sugar ABC transporter permease [Clostridia bacterium]
MHGRTIKRDLSLYIMSVPFILAYILFAYKPLTGLIIAFKEYNLFEGTYSSPWVGLDNFRAFLGGPYFSRTFKNTLILGALGILFGFPAPILLALMINEVRVKWFQRTVQSITFMPYFVSTVVVAGIVVNILSPSTGVVNKILGLFGAEPIYFMTKPEWFRTIYIASGIWQFSGYNAIIYIAALSAVDVQLYEACIIDGGNKFKQIIHVTIPGILPTIIIMFIMDIGNIINVGYEKIILLYQPATYETADILSTYMFRSGIQDGEYGVATAVGLFNSAVSLLMVTATNMLCRKLNNTSLW